MRAVTGDMLLGDIIKIELTWFWRSVKNIMLKGTAVYV